MPSSMKWILIALIAGAVWSGCSLAFWRVDRPVYIERGQAAELARPVRAKVWVTVDGKRELRVVDAQAGWYVGRMGE